jgi:hypothetical protein
MFDFLRGRRDFPVAALDDTVLRDVAGTAYLHPRRPVDDRELAALITAVDDWDNAWTTDLGEAFLPLLGSVLGARVRVQLPAARPRVWEAPAAGAPTMEVHRFGNHYMAGVPRRRERGTEA